MTTSAQRATWSCACGRDPWEHYTSIHERAKSVNVPEFGPRCISRMRCRCTRWLGVPTQRGLICANCQSPIT